MTERVKGCFVAFEQDIRVDDVEPLVHVLEQLRGVAGVILNATHPDDWINRQQIRARMRAKLLSLYESLKDDQQ